MNIEFPPGMPEDQQAFFLKQYERQAMQQDETNMRVRRFMAEIGAEHLRTFSLIVARAATDPAWAKWMEGMADGVLYHIYNICPTCGVNHEEDLEGALAAHPGLSSEPDTSDRGDTEMSFGVVTGVEDNMVTAEIDPRFGDVPPIFDESIPDDLSTLDAVPSEAFMTQEDPSQPGFDMAGNRMASCGSCHGDKIIKVCNHGPGTHGQMVSGDGRTCPEPMRIPCPDCQCPGWYLLPMLVPSPCNHGGNEGPQDSLLPTDFPDLLVCSGCGKEYKLSDLAGPDGTY